MRINTPQRLALQVMTLSSARVIGLALTALPTLAADDSAQLALGKKLFMRGVVPS